MSASLNVPASTAYLDIYGLATGTLLSPSVKANSWTGILPQTQYYVVEVVPTLTNVVSYALTVSCTGTPSNVPYSTGGGSILFAPRTTAAVLHGSVGAGQVVTYTIQASKNQPMILIADSPSMKVTLGVLYPDGSTLLSPTKNWSRWQSKIPVSGLYTIQVFGGATSENFTLTAKVAEVVLFPADSGNTITLYGETTGGFVHSYAFYGNVGSVMTVSLRATPVGAYLDVFGVETGLLLDQTDRSISWTGTLPAMEQYIVEVIPRGGYLTSYWLTVTIH
jgi:hypothetical protein